LELIEIINWRLTDRRDEEVIVSFNPSLENFLKHFLPQPPPSQFNRSTAEEPTLNELVAKLKLKLN